MIFRLLLLLLIIPVPLMALDHLAPQAIDYPSRWGIVSFRHLAHQNRVDNCRICHHQGVEMGPCASCHGVIPGLPQRKDALHKQCTHCHWQRHGPTKCSGCHDPEQLDESVYND